MPGCRSAGCDLLAFIDLGPTSTRIEFPVIYAVARAGRASLRLSDFDDLPAGKAAAPGAAPHPGESRDRGRARSSAARRPSSRRCPAAKGGDHARQAADAGCDLDYDDYVGRLAWAGCPAAASGRAEVAVMRADGSTPRGKVTKIYAFEG